MSELDVPTHPDPASRDALILTLGALLFGEPARLEQTLTHVIDQPFTIAPHAHSDLVQLDVLDGCGGQAWAEGRWRGVSGMSLMVSPPGVEHGYELTPGASPSRVYHCRIRLGRGELDLGRGFAPLLTGLARAEALLAAMRVIVRLGAVPDVRPPLLLARLVEALSLWPAGEGDAHSGRADAQAVPDSHDRGMSAALDLIEQRIADPPSLEELAEVAHFSARHFSRRFAALIGCTPHTYINARRYGLARQLLSQQRLSVGQVAEAAGFGSIATFSRWFRQQAGVSPSTYRASPELM